MERTEGATWVLRIVDDPGGPAEGGDYLNGVIRIDLDFINANRDTRYAPLTVAHEFGHAWADLSGRPGWSNLFAMGYENALRRALRFTERDAHCEFPPLRRKRP